MKKQSHTLMLVAGLGIAAVVYKQRMDAQKAAAAKAALAAQAAAAAATAAAPAPGSMLPGMNGADVLLTAPTGETVASSGQVLGWLGEGYETNDTYDAAPSQYMSRVVNDLKGLSGLLSGAGSGGGLSPIPTVMQATAKPVTQTIAAPVAPPVTPGVRTAAATVAASSPAAAGAVAVGAAQGYTLIEQYGGNHSIWQNSAGQFVTDYTTVPRVSFGGPYPSMAAAEAAIDGVAAPTTPLATVWSSSSTVGPIPASGAGIPASAVIAASPAAAGAAAVGAAAGLTLVENYGGNHSIWSQAGGTQFVTDYTTVPSPTYALGPFASVALAEQAIDQAGFTLAASTLSLAQTYTSPVGPAGNTNVIYTMTPTPGAGAVYLVNPPQPANPSTQLPTSGTGFAASYPTLAAATAAVDAYYSANYAATAATVPTVQTPGLLAQPQAAGVTFVQNYGGHNIAYYNGTYLVDPPANSTISASPFTTYGTLAVATAAIDAQNGTVSAASTGVLSTTPGGTIAPPILIPGQLASGVSFAQSYGGHNIYTYAPAGVGAVYIIDPAIGGTISSGQFLSSYPTMLAATQAIDAANAALTAAMSSQYGSSTDSGGGGYTDDGSSSSSPYSADGSVPMTTQPAAAPVAAPAAKTGNGAVTVVVGGALIAGAAYYFLGK